MQRLYSSLYWLIACLWVTFMLTALLWGWPIGMRFETNDDFWMMQIASGRYTGQPSEFLLYMNVAVGWLLKRLFTWWPSFNSNVALLVSLHLGFVGSVVLVLRRESVQPMGWLWLAAVALLFHGWVYFRLQFTTAAFVGACGAILLVLSQALRSASMWRRSLMAAALLLWFLAYGVRKEAALLAALLALPAFAYVVVKSKTALRMIAATVLSGVLLCIGLEVTHRIYLSRRSDWQQFVRFNLYRGKVHDASGYFYGEKSQSVYAQMGWSPNDVEVFQQWFFPDPEIHSPEDVELLVQKFRRPLEPISAVRAWITTLQERRFWFWAALFLAAGPMMLGVFSTWVFGVGTLLMSMGLQVYLVATAHLPARVLLPMLYAPFLYLLLDRSSQSEAPKIWLIRGWMVGLVVLMGISFRHYSRLAHQHDEMRIAWKKAEDAEMKAGANILALWADDWPVEWERLSLRMDEEKQIKYVSLSSLTQSPHHWEVLRQHGITNLVQALLDRDDIALVCRKERIPSLERYVQEHYGVSIRAENLGGIFGRRIFRIRRGHSDRENSADEQNS